MASPRSGPDSPVAPLPAPGRHRDRLLDLACQVRRLPRWWREEDCREPAWQTWLWTLAVVALLISVALYLGAADWYTAHPALGPDGTTVRLPNTFTGIDHPFHIAKERATLAALRRGWLPRWFSFHQGGFPSEFYPTGGDVVVVFVYALGLGRIPLEVCHKLVVIGVLLLLPLAYWAVVRRDRLPLGIAVAAAVLHLFLRGTWYTGGSQELVYAGLWPDVFASYLPLFVILWGADYLRYGRRWGLLLAAGAGTLAIYSNPRSILAVIAAIMALTAVAVVEGLPPRRTEPVPAHPPRHPRIPPLARAGLLASVLALLSAGLVLPLHAHQSLYYFAHYLAFARVSDVWRYYRQTAPPVVIGFALVGMVIGLAGRGFYGRVFAVLLPVSLLIVTLAGWYLRNLPLFAQLEGPRLMPMLRPVTILLAALGLHETLRALARLVRLPAAMLLAGGLTLGLSLLLVASALSPLPKAQRGLPVLTTTDQPQFTALAQSALAFQALSQPADKPLILGDPISDHTSFWVSDLTSRAAYHGNWLWFWRRLAYGPLDRLKDPTLGLDLDWLTRNGLTMVMIDTTQRNLIDLAATKPYLQLLDPGAPGGYALYRVQSPPGAQNGWITLSSGSVHAVDAQPQRFSAQIQTSAAGVARILINDFPGWQARVNGRPTPISRSDDGYMLVSVPSGDASIVLNYTTEPVVWIARALVAAGIALLLFIIVPLSLRRLRLYPIAVSSRSLPWRRGPRGQ